MALLLGAVACGPAEVVVTMEIEIDNPDGEGRVVRPISDVVVQLLPYDRDAVFDSLQNAFPTPEPEVPQALLDAREQVAQAQARWQSTERRWNNLRDTLQKITATMEQYSRGEARYVALFNEFRDFDAQLSRVERETQEAFTQFTALQEGTIRQSDSIRILQENWADEAFAEAGVVFLAKQRASGLQTAVDTTDASGVARNNMKVRPGQYWLHARYPMGYTELYWNLPITVERGDPVQILLNRANAQERIRL
jgi:hypothetical protein